MTRTHKSNLAKTAIFLLTKIKDNQFDMGDYCIVDSKDKLGLSHEVEFYVVNECKMTCCFAGWGPIALNNSKKCSWNTYIEESFGFNQYNNTWYFLFSSLWENNRKQCASRALQLLEKGKIPAEFFMKTEYNFEIRFEEKTTIKQLVERLKKFVIN